MRVTIFSCFFHPYLFGLPCLSIIPIIFYEITKDKPAKITKVGVVSLQLFFHLQVIRILLILLVVLAGAFFLYSQKVLANL